MREVFGEYRAPTGIVSSHISKTRSKDSEIHEIQKISKITKLKRRPKMLVGETWS